VAGTEESSWALRGLYAWAAGLTILVGFAIVLLLRRPRQRIVQAVNNVSRRIKTGFVPPQRAAAVAGVAGNAILRPSRVVAPVGSPSPSPLSRPPGEDPTPSDTVGPAWMLGGHDADGKTFNARLSLTSLRRLKYGVTVGRHDELCEVLVNHPSLSRRHARFRLQGDALTMEDLNSTNGTTVDGKPLKPFEPHPVDASSVLVLGDLQFSLSKP
jgi:hypothetical protein